MAYPWLLAGAAAIIAAAAWVRVRRVSRRLKRMTQSYWDLRYDLAQLRAQLARLDPQQAVQPDPGPERSPGVAAFVPLSSLKK